MKLEVFCLARRASEVSDIGHEMLLARSGHVLCIAGRVKTEYPPSRLAGSIVFRLFFSPDLTFRQTMGNSLSIPLQVVTAPAAVIIKAPKEAEKLVKSTAKVVDNVVNNVVVPVAKGTANIAVAVVTVKPNKAKLGLGQITQGSCNLAGQAAQTAGKVTGAVIKPVSKDASDLFRMGGDMTKFACEIVGDIAMEFAKDVGNPTMPQVHYRTLVFLSDIFLLQKIDFKSVTPLFEFNKATGVASVSVSTVLLASVIGSFSDVSDKNSTFVWQTAAPHIGDGYIRLFIRVHKKMAGSVRCNINAVVRINFHIDGGLILDDFAIESVQPDPGAVAKSFIQNIALSKMHDKLKENELGDVLSKPNIVTKVSEIAGANGIQVADIPGLLRAAAKTVKGTISGTAGLIITLDVVKALQIAAGVAPQESVNLSLFRAPLRFRDGRLFLFCGLQYVKYDMDKNAVVAGYPKDIAANWGNNWPKWAKVDAALLYPDGRVFLFCDNVYVKFDAAKNCVAPGYPKAIAANWPGWPAGWDRIDAALDYPDGRIFFFRGSQYIKFDAVNDRVAPGYPKQIAGNWGNNWPVSWDHVDSALTYKDGRVFFFRGSEYIKFDVANDRVAPGYPKPIAGNW